VALFSSVLLAKPIPLSWWIAAGLGAVAVALLGVGRGGQHRRVGFSVAWTLVGAVLFSLCDTLAAKWAPALGLPRFLPMTTMAMGVMAVGFVPFFRAGITEIPWAAWRWLLPGSLILAATNAGILSALGHWGDATAVNIVFSSRGLWSVVLGEHGRALVRQRRGHARSGRAGAAARGRGADGRGDRFGRNVRPQAGIRAKEGPGDNPLTPGPAFSVPVCTSLTLPKTLLGQDDNYQQCPCQRSELTLK